MNRMRIVTHVFKANKHANVPSELSRFNKGEELIFLRHEGRRSLFRREGEGDTSDPFSTSDGVFETHTEESKPLDPSRAARL